MVGIVLFLVLVDCRWSGWRWWSIAVTYAGIIFICFTLVQEYYSTWRRHFTVVPVNVIGRMLRFRAMINRYRCFAIAMADCIIDFINIAHASFQIFNLHLLFGTLLLHGAIALASCLVDLIISTATLFRYLIYSIFLTLKPGLIGVV
jgi:hypothetical protein